MIYYSIVPIEYVYKSIEGGALKDLKTIEYKGRKVEVRTLENGCTQILRILSTYPKDFLDAEIQPGTIIN